MDTKTERDFLDTLNKVAFEPSPAMQAGIDFEDAIVRYVEDRADEPSNQAVIEFGLLLEGAVWQERLKRDLKVGDFDILLYGKADAIKLNKIYDIKMTSNYKVGKFKGSIQHLTYMYCMPAKDFEYLVWDGRNTYKESYQWEGNSLEILTSRIAEMLADIFNHDPFKIAFEKNWSAKDDR